VPVTDYTATMTVKPGEGYNSIVEWEGHFNAPPEAKEEDSVKLITDVYVSGLQNLKKIVEKKY
ncbi:MAG: SRPBCC family protein, partial [Nitrososphaera sp.]|nr:SRPBCC family protein [Nitrososphaera sp.]